MAELRAALCLTRRAAETELDLAIGLCRRLPAVFAALEQGLIDLRRARVLIDTTSHLHERIAREVCGQVLERAGGMTTGQLAAHLRRVCIETDPDHARLRYEEALDERVVVAEASPDGTVTITASNLPAERAAAVMERSPGSPKPSKPPMSPAPSTSYVPTYWLIFSTGVPVSIRRGVRSIFVSISPR